MPASAALQLELDVLVEVALPGDLVTEGLRELAGEVLRQERATGDWSVVVMLTDDARLRALHHDFMGIDAETDVMTFPRAEGEAGEGAEQGGDIVVSVERAMEQGPAYGMSGAEEVRFLVVHGLLHLLGWKDGTDEERERMLARQTELIRGIDESG